MAITVNEARIAGRLERNFGRRAANESDSGQTAVGLGEGSLGGGPRISPCRDRGASRSSSARPKTPSNAVTHPPQARVVRLTPQSTAWRAKLHWDKKRDPGPHAAPPRPVPPGVAKSQRWWGEGVTSATPAARPTTGMAPSSVRLAGRSAGDAPGRGRAFGPVRGAAEKTMETGGR